MNLKVDIVTIIPLKDGYRIVVEGLSGDIDSTLRCIADLDLSLPSESNVGEEGIPLGNEEDFPLQLPLDLSHRRGGCH